MLILRGCATAPTSCPRHGRQYKLNGARATIDNLLEVYPVCPHLKLSVTRNKRMLGTLTPPVHKGSEQLYDMTYIVLAIIRL
jgi:hypothetical protein